VLFKSMMADYQKQFTNYLATDMVDSQASESEDNSKVN
jgi:hypothetical protein